MTETTERLVPKGRYWDEFEQGMVLRHKWGKTFTRDEAIGFATQTMNYNPLWFNLEYAKANGHEDVVVCPWLVFHVSLGMTVEDVSEQATALLGYGDIVFHKDIYPGDTITAQSRVEELRESGSKPALGIIRTSIEVVDQRGEQVLTFERTNLIRKSPDAAAQAVARAEAA